MTNIILLRLSEKSTRSLLTLVRRRIKDLEINSRRPAQQARVRARLASGRPDVDAWKIEQFRALEDDLCRSLAMHENRTNDQWATDHETQATP